MTKCECERCQYFERQTVIAQRFNAWMVGGFVCAGALVIIFVIGLVWGLW